MQLSLCDQQFGLYTVTSASGLYGIKALTGEVKNYSCAQTSTSETTGGHLSMGVKFS